MDLLKFIINKKNIKWSCSLSLQPSLLSNFVQKFSYVGPKKNLGLSLSFFKDKQIINF